VSTEGRFRDDYEGDLREWESLVENQYRDSLVLAGEAEAEDEDFRRRRWLPGFVNRLHAYLSDHGDDSVGAASLQQALTEAEFLKGSFTVWLGPVARHWLRLHAAQLEVYFGGCYRQYVKYA
jgi:hypothetical protein